MTWLDAWHETRQLLAEMALGLAVFLAPHTVEGDLLVSAIRKYLESTQDRLARRHRSIMR